MVTNSPLKWPLKLYREEMQHSLYKSDLDETLTQDQNFAVEEGIKPLAVSVMELLAEKNPHETSGQNDNKYYRQNHPLGNEDHFKHSMR